MPAVIFSGSKVKSLKDRMSLNDVTEIISVSADPSTGGGVVAPIGSIAMDYVAGKVYKKYSALATEWKEIGGGFNVVSVGQSVSIGGTITANTLDGFQVLRVQAATPGGNATSATPLGASAYQNGQQFTLLGLSDDYPLTVTSSDVANGFLLNGEPVLYRGSTLTVLFDLSLSRFVEVSRNA